MLVGLILGRYTVESAGMADPSLALPEPAVYVVHHQNLRGPLTSMAWFRRPMRPWVLSVFCDRRACFEQYYGYTLTQRYHFWKPVAATFAYLMALYVPALMHSMRALPVYREPRETIRTFRLSLAALMAGESLLISPDVDYKDSSETVGELYEGFLSLEKYYFRDTGRHVPFIPLHIDVPGHRILVGRTVYCRGDLPAKAARSEASHELRGEMLRMEQASISPAAGG